MGGEHFNRVGRNSLLLHQPKLVNVTAIFSLHTLINYCRARAHARRSVWDGWLVPLVKGWKCLWEIIRLYGLGWSWWFSSKNVPLSSGGHFISLPIHFQAKQLLVTGTVWSLFFVAVYNIEVGKVRPAYSFLASCLAWEGEDQLFSALEFQICCPI